MCVAQYFLTCWCCKINAETIFLFTIFLFYFLGCSALSKCAEPLQFVNYTVHCCTLGEASPRLHIVAKTMAMRARRAKPKFILALGDNFYPEGVASVEDCMWKDNWENVFLRYGFDIDSIWTHRIQEIINATLSIIHKDIVSQTYTQIHTTTSTVAICRCV